MNLSEFLRLSGWDTPEPAQASRMALALDFMTLEMGEQELRISERQKHQSKSAA